MVEVLRGNGTGVSAGGLIGTVVVTLDDGAGLVAEDEAADLVVAMDASEATGSGTGTGVLDAVAAWEILPRCGTGTGVSVSAEGTADAGG